MLTHVNLAASQQLTYNIVDFKVTSLGRSTLMSNNSMLLTIEYP